MATVLANPNFPVLDFLADFTQGPPNLPSAATRKSLQAKYRRLAVRQWGVDRGRQYELDQTQAGTLTTQIVDPLEYLNPDNTGSPYNTGGNTITPYRCVTVTAMWPNQPGSGNLINTKVATDYDPSFELNPDSALGFWVKAGGTSILAQSGVQHFDGTKSLLVTQSAAGVGFGATNRFRTSPDLTYTFSVYVFPTGGCTVTAQVLDANGTVTSSATSTTSSSWQRLVLTWTAVDASELITVYGAGVSTPTFYMDATMLEFGASANTFTTTGPTLYFLYTGYIERYPTSYDMSGFRAVRPLSAVDALAILARTVISQSYLAEIGVDNPTVFVPLSNTKPATSGGALSTGSETTKIAKSNITGDPSYIVSPTGSINWNGDQLPDGSQAVTFTQQNANKPPIPGGSDQDTYMDVVNGSLSFDTVNGGVMEVWARPVSGGFMFGGMLRGPAGTPTNYSTSVAEIAFERYPTGGIIALYNHDGSTPNDVSITASNGIDNQWHYYAITVTNGQYVVMVDASESGAVTATTPGVIGFNFLCHNSANTGFGDPQAQVSVARWAVYSTNITFARRLAHYNRGVGYIGEISGARVARLLALYWAGPSFTANGVLAMAPDHDYDGRVLLDVLSEIQESERGLVYADVLGDVVFEDRESRYINQAALWVFGENPTGASPVEYPYEAYETDLDPTYTFSDADLTRPGNSEFPPIVNTATRAKYGQRVLSQQLQATTDSDLTQAGIFYTNRYATPKTRITKLTLRPSANPALWPVVLSLEISQRIKVRRRNAGLTITGEYYIEKLTWKGDAETGDTTLDILASPVFVPTAWLLNDTTYGVLGTTTVPIY